jgi:hypothetical protein
MFEGSYTQTHHVGRTRMIAQLAILLNRLPQETWRRVVQDIVVLLAEGRVDRPSDLRRGPANSLDVVLPLD